MSIYEQQFFLVEDFGLLDEFFPPLYLSIFSVLPESTYITFAKKKKKVCFKPTVITSQLAGVVKTVGFLLSSLPKPHFGRTSKVQFYLPFLLPVLCISD